LFVDEGMVVKYYIEGKSICDFIGGYGVSEENVVFEKFSYFYSCGGIIESIGSTKQTDPEKDR